MSGGNPLCRHFGTCGGCAFQDLTAEDYRARKHADIAHALARYHFDEALIEPVRSVAPGTRRRAALKIGKKNGKVESGFHAQRSHVIVDMLECKVLTPPLTALVQQLRGTFGNILREGEETELHITETDTGFDIAIGWKRSPKPAIIAELAQAVAQTKIARITAGGDILVERAQPTVRLGKAAVKLPPDAFLQPTREGEHLLQSRVLDIAGKAKRVADLFAGCGTFTFPLAERAQVHAVEQSRPALDALAAAARATQGLRPVTAERRDLFRNPLGPAELKTYDALVLDPPRAGAQAQCAAIAKSPLRLVAYVSCNPATFARDARALVDGGFTLSSVMPVDQFLWSSHTEIVAAFVRG